MLVPILTLTAFFLLGLVLRYAFPHLCAICFAVTLGWLMGFFAGWDKLVVAMLMGGSAVGLMYYLSSKLGERWQALKLPYLLTAFALIYFLLVEFEWRTALVLVVLWIMFAFLHGDNLKKVVECCKNW